MKSFYALVGWQGLLSFLLVWVVLILGFQNLDTVSVRFLFWDVIMTKKIWLILISVIIGFLAGTVFGWKMKR